MCEGKIEQVKITQLQQLMKYHLKFCIGRRQFKKGKTKIKYFDSENYIKHLFLQNVVTVNSGHIITYSFLSRSHLSFHSTETTMTCFILNYWKPKVKFFKHIHNIHYTRIRLWLVPTHILYGYIHHYLNDIYIVSCARVGTYIIIYIIVVSSIVYL